jgi:hypothetical protein
LFSGIAFQQEVIQLNMAKRFQFLLLNTEDNPSKNKTEIFNDRWFRLGYSKNGIKVRLASMRLTSI